MHSEFDDYPYHDSTDGNQLIATAWVTGLIGAFAILAAAIFCAQFGVIYNNNLKTYELLGYSLNASNITLLLIALSMISCEIFKRWRLEGGGLCKLSPMLVEKKYGAFLWDCLRRYLGGLIIAGLIWLFYAYCSEYGMQKGNAYYLTFFQLLDLGISAYIYGGFFYLAFTRGFQHSPKHDEFGLAKAFLARIISVINKLPCFNFTALAYKPADKIALLGLVVKVFFLPLMTVFFFDQFTHLCKNFSYLLNNFSSASTSGEKLFRDFFNISFSVIFAIDVGIAWVGYAFSSRWLKNTNFSVDPSVFGWVVAAFCYPPLNRSIMSIYLPLPSERFFLSWEFSWWVVLIGSLSIVSYFIYMSATVVFGLRFSNLTHRGIITKGPFAVVRHPAYAAKNFSWWCLMAPVVIYSLFQGKYAAAVPQLFGLIGITSWYYFRAITEERHLSWDPEYRRYCAKVKYRFFPGIG